MATLEFRKGDGISVNANIDFPANSSVNVTAHVVDAADYDEAVATFAAYVLPASATTINGVDLSECLVYGGTSNIQLVGFSDCNSKIYAGSIIFENINNYVSTL